MNVYQNISFGLVTEKISKIEIKKKVIEVSKILKIVDLLERKPVELSGGQRQRVAIGRPLLEIQNYSYLMNHYLTLMLLLDQK